MIFQDSPWRGFDRRCAFPEVPAPFGSQNASHHQYALACGYLQSRLYLNLPVQFQFSWNPPLVAASDCDSLQIKHDARCAPFYLPVMSHCFQPDSSERFRSHCCNLHYADYSMICCAWISTRVAMLVTHLSCSYLHLYAIPFIQLLEERICNASGSSRGASHPYRRTGGSIPSLFKRP